MNWRDDAACLEVGTDVFFPEQGDAGQSAKAKTVCFGCPVRSECLEEALRLAPHDYHDFGVWGGTSPVDRRKIRRQRRELKGAA